jgi:hypothetical protein
LAQEIMSIGTDGSDQASFAECYAQMSDGELFRLASERSSLVDAAKVALDRELSKRSLTPQYEICVELSESAVPERPYGWGKFVGGATVVSALVAAIARGRQVCSSSEQKSSAD